MLTIRPARERGHGNHGWLDSWHTFSFAGYYDPRFMGFRSLRVINEDKIAGGQGFGTHPHSDMEILTYMLDGALEHRDSISEGGVIRPGDVQYMSAGTGIRHSEYNASKTETAHLLQIWLLPNKEGVRPNYGQKHFPIAEGENTLHHLASGKGTVDGAIPIHADAEVFAGKFSPKATMNHEMNMQHAWLQMARGSMNVNGTKLNAGDAAAISDEKKLELQTGDEAAEFLLFELA